MVWFTCPIGTVCLSDRYESFLRQIRSFFRLVWLVSLAIFKYEAF